MAAIPHTQTNHWPDGTPRSTGNAFAVLYTLHCSGPKPTAADIARERNRANTERHNRVRDAKARILRDNHNHSFAVTLPTAADNAKTVRIQGRP